MYRGMVAGPCPVTVIVTLVLVGRGVDVYAFNTKMTFGFVHIYKMCSRDVQLRCAKRYRWWYSP